jgi:hemoglobin
VVRQQSRIRAAGSGVELDVAHRRLLDPAPGLRPLPDGEFFRRIGGQATVDRLVDALYVRFDADRVIRAYFGGNLSAHREKQKTFFAEWLGGPFHYSESAWGGLYRHHEDLPITAEVAERWLGHFRGALTDTLTDETDVAAVLERARSVALALVNHDGAAPDARGGRDSSKHRSERIASCGVGARTLKRAVQLAQRGKVAELALLVLEVPEAVERPAFAARLLQTATLAGRGEVVGWLIDHGVDVNGPAPLNVNLIGGAFELVFYVTPLCAARMTRHSDICTYLLDQGAREDIFTASFLGDLALLRQMLSERPSLAQISDPAADVLIITPIHHAVGGNQLSTLGVLLEHTTEPVRAGARALRAAAGRRDRAMVEILLQHGADARAVGAGAWVLDPEIAPRLAASGASAGVGTSGKESGDWVRISCTGNQGRKDNPVFVEALLRYGARVDQRYNGATPLHYVAKAGFVHTIEVLLEHGAERDALDDRGRTPLDWLAQAAKSVDRDAVRGALATSVL